MHAEWGRLDAATAEALNATRARGGRIVAVGTTSARLLESAAGEDGALRAFEGETAIFITPGYRFRAVDALLTNFHLPRSTLFMLVSAFSGLETMKRAYAHAIAERLSLLFLRRRLPADRARGLICLAPWAVLRARRGRARRPAPLALPRSGAGLRVRV